MTREEEKKLLPVIQAFKALFYIQMQLKDIHLLMEHHSE